MGSLLGTKDEQEGLWHILMLVRTRLLALSVTRAITLEAGTGFEPVRQLR
jgi:hypothetical protein